MSEIFGKFGFPAGVGAVAVAVEINGEVAYSASGDAGDRRTPSENTLFDIGSITKPLTGVALADMALRGEVDLNAQVSKYLPEVKSRPTGAITVLQLATHRAGLPLRPPSSDGNEAITQYEGVTRESVLNDFCQCEPGPGLKYEYSNWA